MVLKVSNNIINEMQNTTSMVENFPDAIKCTKDTIFLLSYGHHTYREYDQGWYAQVGASSFSGIKFNADGTYHSRSGFDQSTKGCLGQSIQQLYNEGRAFNFVNDPEQPQKIQKLEQENVLLKKQIKNIAQRLNNQSEEYKKENTLLKAHIQKLDLKFEKLERTIEELQKNMPKKITSDDCFEIFTKQNVEMCIENRDTQITFLPPFTVAKSDSCIDREIFDICIEKFKLKGIVPCDDGEYIF